MITVTESAKTKISDLLAEEGNPNLFLRTFVQGGGCSGFSYGFTFDENGIKKSFKERLKDGPFLQNELDILLKAEEQSNNLAKLETEAFIWIDKGKPEMVDDIQTHHFMAAQLLMFV